MPGTYTADAAAAAVNSQPVTPASGVAPITIAAVVPTPTPTPTIPIPVPTLVPPPIVGGGPGTVPLPVVNPVPPAVVPPAVIPPVTAAPAPAVLTPPTTPPVSLVVPVPPASGPTQQAAPPLPTAQPPAPPAGTVLLSLGRPDSFPGGSATLNGTGCPAGSPVQLRTGNLDLGSTTAGPDGSFSASVLLPSRLSAGRITVTAICGGQQASSELDLVLTTSSGSSAGASAVTAAAAVAFFVLFGLLLSQGRQTPDARRPS